MNANHTGTPATEAQAGAMLAAKPEIIDIDGVKVFVTPEGMYRVMDELLKAPIRKTGFQSLRDLKSFLAFAKAKTLNAAEIFLTAEGAIQARLTLDADTFGQYGAFYNPVPSQSFRDWTKADGEKMDQTEFALFIERHIDDIHPGENLPSAGDLLTFCSAIEDKRTVTFKKSVSLQDGRVELTYAEKTSDAAEQKMQLFREFQIALRPYLDRDATYAVRAALRFRIRDGAISFWYELKGLEAVREQIRSDIRKELEASGLPVYLADI